MRIPLKSPLNFSKLGLLVLDGRRGGAIPEGVIIGRSRSMVQAGALAVVLSLWKVKDETAETQYRNRCFIPLSWIFSLF